MKPSTLPEAIWVSRKGFIPATINPRGKLRGIGAAIRGYKLLEWAHSWLSWIIEGSNA